MLLMAVCLLASVYSTLGMRTVYYRDGQVCDVCTEQHDTVPYRQSYTQSEVGKRVVYQNEERIISRPSSSSSYVVNRADYSARNLSSFIYDLVFAFYILLPLAYNVDITYMDTNSHNVQIKQKTKKTKNIQHNTIQFKIQDKHFLTNRTDEDKVVIIW